MNTNRYGWEKIAKVEPQIWLDQNSSREYEIVWIVTADDNVYQRSIEVGESAEEVTRRYASRGWTDSKCVFFEFQPGASKGVAAHKQ